MDHSKKNKQDQNKQGEPAHERREKGDLPRQAPKPGRGQVPEKNANQDPSNPTGAR